jgi:antitoxin component YwqK of YwqJK toxin-antitoxin module
MVEHKVEYYDNGTKDYECWFKGNSLHREDGPALISYYDNGNKDYESWYKDGEYHREDGPAYTRYNLDGSKHYETWDLCQQEYTESAYNDIIKLGKSIVTRDAAIMNIKHPLKFIQRKCQEILNGRT